MKRWGKREKDVNDEYIINDWYLKVIWIENSNLLKNVGTWITDRIHIIIQQDTVRDNEAK